MRPKTIEEYVETIYCLEKKEGRASTGTLAALMGVKPPSITELLQKLEKEGFVKYQSHAGATLTPKGRVLAEELMRKHRAVEEFLVTIGIRKETAEIDACQIEHHVSHETVCHIEELIRSIRLTPEIAVWFEEFRKSFP